MIAHPIGRLFNYFFHKIKNVIYLSPYYEIKLKNRKIYNDFTAAFQTCVGTALLAGFKEIHFCGFDAWLLAPKNSIRWFSNCQNPKKYDYKNNLTNKIPLFLKLASEVAKLKVYTFNHYKSKYKVINSIKIKNKVKYNNRKNSMNKHSLNIWSNYENIRFPNGYNVKNQE